MTTRQPEALRLAEMLTANEWPGHVTLVSYARECVAELRAQHARITELEAQLEAVGAGGVGPLIACAGFSAADMATAAAQGFRDGAAATARPVAEPADTAALPESFLEIPDVQDESGINAYYSREAVLECIDAALASHGQAPAQPDPAYSEACNLATALFKKHFAHLPDYASGQVVWGLFDSTEGVILQIDNMVSGLVQPPTTSPQADSVLYDPKAVLDVFNSARAGSEKPVGYLRGILAVIAHWESRPEPHRWMVPVQADSVPAAEREQERIAFKAWGRPMFKHSNIEASWLGWIARASRGKAPAPADSVQDDSARLDWLLLRVSGAEFRRIGVHYSGNARRADVDAARKQGASHDR